MKKILYIVASIFILWGCASDPSVETDSIKVIESPNGKLKMTFLLTSDGRPQYLLDYEDRHVILKSGLGFELRGVLKSQKIDYHPDGTITKSDSEPCNSLYDGFSIESVDTVYVDETWEPVWGEEETIRNNYNELLVSMIQRSTGRKMAVRSACSMMD